MEITEGKRARIKTMPISEMLDTFVNQKQIVCEISDGSGYRLFLQFRITDFKFTKEKEKFRFGASTEVRYKEWYVIGDNSNTDNWGNVMFSDRPTNLCFVGGMPKEITDAIADSAGFKKTMESS